MKKKFCFILSYILIVGITSAQHPFKHWMDAMEIRYDATQPVINYSLTVDSNDFNSFSVEMRIKNISDSFQVAMVAHPEYDDRYWRYVEDFSVKTKNGIGKIIREDSALWKIITSGGEAILNYKIHLPVVEGIRSSWKAYLTSTGGLIGGPHSFMYVVGSTLAPSHVTLHLPSGWQIATGLQSTTDPNTFFASSVFTLIDDPIFVGKFKSWSFTVDNIPHRFIYWSLPNASDFDMQPLVSAVKKIVEQASLLFERLPYRDFTFILQDGAVGGLEHNNSVTLGAPVSQLSNGINRALSELTHEYFHSWNLVRIHPTEYRDVDHKTPPLSKGLWFSEGFTIFYTNLLTRRTGFPVFDSLRTSHLETLISRYFSSPAYLKFSAEQISLASYAPTGMLGDYSGSTHLQGEVIGAMLDLIIRDATNGERSIDDVMRKMMERFSGEKGFTSKDVEQIVKEVCGCDVHQFFQDHVFGTKQIDFKKYLQLIGLEYSMEWKDAMANDGEPVPDLRMYSYQLPNENIIRIGITTPTSCWGKAGLHTGDILKAMNGKSITSTADFRNQIRTVKIGDEVSMEIFRSSKPSKINILVEGYQQPVVHVSSISTVTEKQKKLFKQWSDGK